MPPLEGDATVAVVASDEVVSDSVQVGDRVVIYDWLADWTGVGLAEKLATEGREVTLAVNGICAAAAIQNYVRDAAIARLFKLQVKTLPFMRLYGVDGSSAYFIHTAAQESVIIEDVDTVVTVYPGIPETSVAAAAKPLCANVQLIGDAMSPRTAEEAVYEGLFAAPTSAEAESHDQTECTRIIISQVDPRSPATRALIEELDRHLNRLYPAENNYSDGSRCTLCA